MNLTESEMLATIRDITDENTALHRFPTFALSIDIARRVPNTTIMEIHQIAELLVQAGAIRIGKTVNYEYYELLNYATTH